LNVIETGNLNAHGHTPLLQSDGCRRQCDFIRILLGGDLWIDTLDVLLNAYDSQPLDSP